MWQQRVGRDLCWSVWSESRGGAPFCWLSVPLCSPTVVKLLTGTFHERWRKCTIYSFTPTHTHTHTHTCTYCIHTHLEGLHGFTWSAGPQPAAAANNPSSHFSPGSVSTVHPFTALLFKTCRHVCVCVCVSEWVCVWVVCTEAQNNSESCLCAERLIPATLCLVIDFIFNWLHLFPQQRVVPVMYYFPVCTCTAKHRMQRGGPRAQSPGVIIYEKNPC